VAYLFGDGGEVETLLAGATDAIRINKLQAMDVMAQKGSSV